MSLELSDKIATNRRLTRWISSISSRIEMFLNRELELKSRIQFFDSGPGQLEYFTDAYPITTITKVESDWEGLYDSPTDETDFFPGRNEDAVILDVPVTPAKRGLRITYIGGISEHGVNSEYTMASSLTAGKFLFGVTSGAAGFVITGGTSAVIEVLYGVFDAGENTQQYDEEDLVNTFGSVIVLTTKDKESLAEINPDIVEATELEIRYMNDHRSNFENDSTVKGATKRANFTEEYNLLPQTRSLLSKYQNIILI